MRNNYKVLFGTILLFGIITLATSSLESNADGADKYGFPFNFYTKAVGYNIETKQGDISRDFDGLSLASDILFALILSWLLFWIFNKNRLKKSTQ
ncbi:MAG: hypothetical protein EOO96_08990 [Pedobacter sp.]|nr:MAG: hypothetical protein EOO96_08990 [Pedobacter sp.]